MVRHMQHQQFMSGFIELPAILQPQLRMSLGLKTKLPHKQQPDMCLPVC